MSAQAGIQGTRFGQSAEPQSRQLRLAAASLRQVRICAARGILAA